MSIKPTLLGICLSDRSWQPKLLPYSLFLLLIILCLSPLGFSHAQFVPSQHTDVQGNKDYEFTLIRDEPYGIYIGATVLWTANGTLHTARIFLNDQQVLLHRSTNGDTGTGQQNGQISRLVKSAFTAGTKIRLKGIIEAPGDPGARLFALSAGAVNYDAAVNLKNLEQKINSLETALQGHIHQNTGRINELASQILNLKTELNNFRQRFDALNLDYSQFKTDIAARIDTLDKRITSVENYLNAKIAALTQRLDSLDRNYSQFKTDTDARLAKANQGASSLFEGWDQFKSDTHSRLSAINDKNINLEKRFATIQADHGRFKNRLSTVEKRALSQARLNNTLGILGISLGGGTALWLGGGAIISAIEEHKNPDIQHMSKSNPWRKYSESARGWDGKGYSESLIK